MNKHGGEEGRGTRDVFAGTGGGAPGSRDSSHLWPNPVCGLQLPVSASRGRLQGPLVGQQQSRLYDTGSFKPLQMRLFP